MRRRHDAVLQGQMLELIGLKQGVVGSHITLVAAGSLRLKPDIFAEIRADGYLILGLLKAAPALFEVDQGVPEDRGKDDGAAEKGCNRRPFGKEQPDPEGRKHRSPSFR